MFLHFLYHPLFISIFYPYFLSHLLSLPASHFLNFLPFLHHPSYTPHTTFHLFSISFIFYLSFALLKLLSFSCSGFFAFLILYYPFYLEFLLRWSKPLLMLMTHKYKFNLYFIVTFWYVEWRPLYFVCIKSK